MISMATAGPVIGSEPPCPGTGLADAGLPDTAALKVRPLSVRVAAETVESVPLVRPVIVHRVAFTRQSEPSSLLTASTPYPVSVPAPRSAGAFHVTASLSSPGRTFRAVGAP